MSFEDQRDIESLMCQSSRLILLSLIMFLKTSLDKEWLWKQDLSNHKKYFFSFLSFCFKIHISSEVSIKIFFYDIQKIFKISSNVLQKIDFLSKNVTHLPGNTSRNSWLGTWIHPFLCWMMHWNIARNISSFTQVLNKHTSHLVDNFSDTSRVSLFFLSILHPRQAHTLLIGRYRHNYWLHGSCSLLRFSSFVFTCPILVYEKKVLFILSSERERAVFKVNTKFWSLFWDRVLFALSNRFSHSMHWFLTLVSLLWAFSTYGWITGGCVFAFFMSRDDIYSILGFY